MKKAPKILVCCPTSDKKAYCDLDFFEMVQSFSYPNYDVFLADNSSDLQYLKKIQSNGIKATHINTANKPFSQILADSHNACREHAIKHQFDFMLHLESDIFPGKPDIIQRLLRNNKPVVAVPYHIDHVTKSRLAIQVEQPMQLLGQYHFINHVLDNGSDLLFIDGTLKPIIAGGLGCVLIHKSIFTRFPFRYEKNQNHYPDTFFYVDLLYAGIQPYMDTSLICEHRNIDSTDWNAVVNKVF